jgi:hypothetical protein
MNTTVIAQRESRALDDGSRTEYIRALERDWRGQVARMSVHQSTILIRRTASAAGI